MDLYFRR